MTKTHKDTAGNAFKQGDNDQWYILKKGVGWVGFSGTTFIEGVGIIDQSPPQNEPSTQEIDQRSAENDLFIHFAGLAMQGLTQRRMPKDTANMACDHAQAMIDELKERGKL